MAAIGLSVTAYIGFQVKQNIDETAARQFAFTCDQVSLKIRERLGAYALTLRGGVALFDASDSVSRREWKNYTETLRAEETVQGVQGIGFSEAIPPRQLARHVARIRREGFPNYKVYPDGKRELYTAIVYLEPFRDRNLRAFGYDMFSEPVRRAAMEQARDTGEAALSGKVELVQETGTDVQAGALMYVPVYHRDLPHETVAQKRIALSGWVYSPYRMKDLMAGILGDWENRDSQTIGLYIYDGAEPTPARLLFAGKRASVEENGRLILQQKIIAFNGRQWLLAFSRPALSYWPGYALVWATLASGTTVTGLLFGLMLSVISTQANAKRIADKLTKDIRDREELLTASEYRWRFALEGAGDGVWDWNLVDNKVFYSKRSKELFGFAEDEFVDCLDDWIALIHPDDKAETLAVLRASLTRDTPYTSEYRILCRDGACKWLHNRGMVVHRGDGGKPLRMIGTCSDITERKQAECRLEEAYSETRRFRDALDYVSSLVYMKDTQSRYVYANQLTLNLFGVSADELTGSDDYRFFPPSTAKQLQAIDLRVFQGEQTIEEIDVNHPDIGRRVYLEIKTPIYEQANGQPIWGLLGISTDITALKEHEKHLEHIAHYDSLTGLPNRVLLADRMRQAMAQTLRRAQKLAVAYIDLDGFKAVNDLHGHDAGDQLLMAVAHNMKQVLREGDTLARLGGDEFVAVLLDITDIKASEPIILRLLSAAAHPVMRGEIQLQISASVGVTFFPQEEEQDADQLLRQADQAMYQAKLAGKNNYHIFNTEHDRLIRGHYESVERIRRALAEREFVLYYQPKVNMRTGQVIGVEALIRWRHPERGLLLPTVFLPSIEDHTLVVEVGEWVIDSALRQMALWRAQGLHMAVSVNVGARQLQQANFVERLKVLLARHPVVAPSDLELEVLETSAFADLAQVCQIMKECRELGVCFALDDFGTGYSSLTYLKRLSADRLKIDQSFVRDMLDDPEDMAILEGVLGLAVAFRIEAIAEGVESVEHGERLLQLGCELAQGYGIARPMPPEELPAWLNEWRPAPSWSGQAVMKRGIARKITDA